MNLFRSIAVGVLLIGLVSPLPALADDHEPDPEDLALHFDDPVALPPEPPSTDTLNPLEPADGDFEIVAVSFMSNRLGDRWALVTLHNGAGGKRILRGEYLVGLFADGSRSRAQALDVTMSSGETVTRSVSFGRSVFPLVQVLVK